MICVSFRSVAFRMLLDLTATISSCIDISDVVFHNKFNFLKCLLNCVLLKLKR